MRSCDVHGVHGQEDVVLLPLLRRRQSGTAENLHVRLPVHQSAPSLKLFQPLPEIAEAYELARLSVDEPVLGSGRVGTPQVRQRGGRLQEAGVAVGTTSLDVLSGAQSHHARTYPLGHRHAEVVAEGRLRAALGTVPVDGIDEQAVPCRSGGCSLDLPQAEVRVQRRDAGNQLADRQVRREREPGFDVPADFGRRFDDLPPGRRG